METSSSTKLFSRSRNFAALFVFLVPFLALAGTGVDNLNLSGNTLSTTNTNGHLILSPNGTGKLELPTLGASTVPYLDSNKRLTSSLITPTELGYLSGASSNLQTQISAKVTGPASSTDSSIALFDGTTGKLLKSPSATITDTYANFGTRQVLAGDAALTQAQIDALKIVTPLELTEATDSTTTGSSQNPTITAASTVFTNASLSSISNFTFTPVLGTSPYFIIKNGKASGAITLVNGTNLVTGTGADLELSPGQAVSIIKDNGNSKWQVVGGSGGGSSSYASGADSSATGSDQDVTITNAVTIFTNGSLNSIRNFTTTGLGSAPLFVIKNGQTKPFKLVNDSGGTAANRILTGTGYDLVIPAAGTATLLYDNTNTRWQVVSTSTAMAPIAQAQVYGSINYAGATNCNWSGATTAAWGSPSADTDCNTPTVTGNASAPATKVPAITFATMPPGKYVVKSNPYFFASGVAADTTCVARFHDGTNAGTLAQGVVYRDSSDGDVSMAASTFVEQVFEYTTTQTSKTISLQTYNSTPSGTCIINASSAVNDFSIIVEYFPLTADTVVTAAADNWRVDANISGANPSLGTSDISSYTGIESGSLTLTNATSNNVSILQAQIPCSSTNAPSGTTCSSGNESIGVSFTIPKAQDVKACVEFSHNAITAAASSIDATFQIVETPSNAQTISQEGKSRTQSINLVASTNLTNPFNLCGTFSFASAGQKTLRLMYEQDVSGTPTSNTILADASTTVGQRDIHWTVEPIDTVNGKVSLGLPTITRLTSGSGTYTTPVGVKYLKVKMVGGGGGGAGSGTTTTAGAGGAGGATTFGSSLLTANNGTGGAASSVGGMGTGGSCTVNSPAITLASIPGSNATFAASGTSTYTFSSGGGGGATAFGGAGGGTVNGLSQAGATNSGSGGAGGGSGSIALAIGFGGGAGCYIEAMINNPAPTYPYSVGAGGAAGTAGTSGYAGGAGGSGVIILEEHYNFIWLFVIGAGLGRRRRRFDEAA